MTRAVDSSVLAPWVMFSASRRTRCISGAPCEGGGPVAPPAVAQMVQDRALRCDRHREAEPAQLPAPQASRPAGSLDRPDDPFVPEQERTDPRVATFARRLGLLGHGR